MGKGPRRLPLVLLHGWPSAHYEFWSIAEPLAFPSRHGGDAADAFDLVIVSLRGYGFSMCAGMAVGMRRTADGFQEPGFSKERRLEPQITIGLSTDGSGFPVMVEAFEGTRTRPTR